ncbi:MAG: hypothetical protein RSC00_07565, partial [Ruthenibacterium sp.]
TTKRTLEMAEYLMHHTTQELVDKYKRNVDYSGIIRRKWNRCRTAGEQRCHYDHPPLQGT